MSYLDKQLNLAKIFANLPSDVLQAIGEVDIVSEIWEIGDNFHLLFNEIGDICEETARIITGKTRPENFVENIHSKLGEDNKSKANQVATEINNKILIPIRDAYKKISMGSSSSKTADAGVRLSRPQAEIPRPAENSQPVLDNNLPDDKSIYRRSFNRDFIMNEIENPTPTGVSTMPYEKQTTNNKSQVTEESYEVKESEVQAPINLPVGNTPEREIPVIRTMSRDIEMTNGGQSATGNQPTINEQMQPRRGKFGHGTPPTIRQNSSRQDSPRTELNRKEDSQQQFPKNPPENQGFQKESATSATNYPPASREQVSKQQDTSSATPSFIPIKQGAIGGTIKGYSQPSPRTPQPASKQTWSSVNKLSEENLDHQDLKQSKQDDIQSDNESTPDAVVTPTSPAPAETIVTMPKRQPPIAPEKTERVDDLVGDKLTKTVGVPSERKRYVVDPYREPLDES